MTICIDRVADPTDCYAIRHVVFVEEQGVPLDMEIDEFDATAIHLLATQDGAPVGAARIVISGETGKIGRVCVLKSARGTGLGALLIETAVSMLRQQSEIRRAALGARVDAVGFYERLGFTTYGAVFDDAGIDHQMMEMQLRD